MKDRTCERPGRARDERAAAAGLAAAASRTGSAVDGSAGPRTARSDVDGSGSFPTTARGARAPRSQRRPVLSVSPFSASALFGKLVRGLGVPALLAALGAEVVRGRAAEGALADLAQLAHVVEGSHQLGHVPTPPSVVLTASMSPRRSWSKPPSGCRVVPAGARGAGRSRAAGAVQPPRAGRGPARSDPLAAMSVVPATTGESTPSRRRWAPRSGPRTGPRRCAPAPPRGGPAGRSLRGVHRAGAEPGDGTGLVLRMRCRPARSSPPPPGTTAVLQRPVPGLAGFAGQRFGHH